MQENNSERRILDLKSLRDSKLQQLKETEQEIETIIRKPEKVISDFFRYEILRAAQSVYINDICSLYNELELVMKAKESKGTA